MPWHSKEQATPFISSPISGLHELHGDVFAKHYQQEGLSGQKYPLVEFPSGLTREVRPGQHDENQPTVHIWGAVSLPYHSTRDTAYELAQPIAHEHDYQIFRQWDNQLTLMNREGNRAYHLMFDNERGHLVDLILAPNYAMELLDGQSRAVLPRLYANEKLGLDAVAPVKFFTPDSRWTWYPTEYDGQDLFFGLVSGLDLELGYFGLSELESVRGPLKLPIERDLYYKPTTLRELQRLHDPHHGQ